MGLVALAVPRLADADGRWLQAIRAEHDPQVGLVAPHFTLVFPTAAVPAEDFRRHVTGALAGAAAIDFVLRGARAAQDPIHGGWHVGLVAEEGAGDITRLHDCLYVQILAGELRADIPYVPHMTVGKFAEEEPARGLAARLADGLALPGRIETVDVMRLAEGRLVRLESIRLP